MTPGERSAREWVERPGGEDALRAVVEDFYGRVFADTMIGFFFRRADRARLVEKELELVLRMLGADRPYTGRPLDAVHAPHRIFGGQFDRRLQLLRETMEDHGLPGDVRALWVAESEGLRGQITGDAAGECRPPDPPASEGSGEPP